MESVESDSPSGSVDHFNGVLVNVLKDIPFKLVFFFYMISIFIFSDLFADGVLSSIPDTMHGSIVNTKGTMIRLFFASLVIVILQLLIINEVL